MRARILVGLAAIGAMAALAPAASASIGTPTVTLTPSSGTAGSTANLGVDIKFSPSGGDSTKDLTLELPPGLIANASIDNGACLKSATPTTACQVGTGTVTATENVLVPLPVTLNATFDLVAPPSPSDLAGLQAMVVAPGSSTPTSLILSVSDRALRETAGLESQAKRGKLKRLNGARRNYCGLRRRLDAPGRAAANPPDTSTTWFAAPRQPRPATRRIPALIPARALSWA